MGIGKRIKSMRDSKGLTKADLARILDVSSTAVYNWEALDTRPRGGTMLSLCRVLGTTEDWLVKGEAPPPVRAPSNKTADVILNEAKEALASIVGVNPDRIKVRFEVE